MGLTHLLPAVLLWKASDLLKPWPRFTAGLVEPSPEYLRSDESDSAKFWGISWGTFLPHLGKLGRRIAAWAALEPPCRLDQKYPKPPCRLDQKYPKPPCRDDQNPLA